MTFRTEPGWVGAFTREQAEGAIPNGSRIVKVLSEKGDTHPLGAKGTVLGSIRAAEPSRAVLAQFVSGNLRQIDCAYFVEWDGMPNVAVGVMGFKIAPDEEGGTTVGHNTDSHG